MLLLTLACTTTTSSSEPMMLSDHTVQAVVIHTATSTDQVGPWTNRLISETSPYLLQHAHNPVDWRPWGQEAFDEARSRDVPIFLSIGYSACHWCHVMEHESFADPEIAGFLNEHYVAIKVDREERPDVDSIYMDTIHLMNGSGGWPASLWLTPDLVPFYAGTYFPPRSRYGRPGFIDVLRSLSDSWLSDPEGVTRTTRQVMNALERNVTQGAGSGQVSSAGLPSGVRQLQSNWDSIYGGWQSSRKFPMVPRLEFLLSWAVATGDEVTGDMVVQGLDAMDRGGIHDQVGGGFHRYTVDSEWIVPHFEKMLYDNGQMLSIYAEAAVAFDNHRFGDVARGVARYLIREMQSETGAFYASMDADDAGGEGSFYVWNPSSLAEVLGAERAASFMELYAVSLDGNFEHGETVLTRLEGDVAPFDQDLEALLAHRATRSAPATDHKRVVGWNGLVIGGVAKAGRLLGEPEFTAAAVLAAANILDSVEAGQLLPRTIESNAPRGVIDDQAFMINALIDLYEATGTPRWLIAANALLQSTLQGFGVEDGGFYHSLGSADLIVRQIDPTDGAEPSGYGRMTKAMRRLRSYGSLTATTDLIDGALSGAAAYLDRSIASVPTLAETLHASSRQSMEVVLAYREGQEQALEPFLELYNSEWRPYSVLAVVRQDEASELLEFGALVGKESDSDGPVAYVCFDGACRLPTTDLDQFESLMNPDN